MKSSSPQQDAMTEAWTADFLALGQALYHWATLTYSGDWKTNAHCLSYGLLCTEGDFLSTPLVVLKEKIKSEHSLLQYNIIRALGMATGTKTWLF